MTRQTPPFIKSFSHTL